MPSSDHPALLFDLDGTLVDSVYHHVLAWSDALAAVGIEMSIWRIHRRIGMSGGLFAQALARETDVPVDDALRQELRDRHAASFKERLGSISPLPGAQALLEGLTESNVPWAIATSGRMLTAGPLIEKLGLPVGDMTIVTRDQVAYAKPNPDLFEEAARRLDVPPSRCFVVGDSVWDILAARRAGALGVGLLSGGYGDRELVDAGAFRVFDDPAALKRGLFELGVRV